MTPLPIDIVTIAHEHRSGGSAIARRVGERLGWLGLDGAALLQRAARRLGVEVPEIAGLDEHPASVLEQLGAGLLFAAPEAPLGFTPEYPTTDDVAAAVAAEVASAAAQPPLVVVGHGAQCVLRGWAGALHVNVVAPLADRVARELRETHAAPALALAEVQRRDHDRVTFHRRHHKAACADPLLYDLQFNTARLVPDEAAALIVAVVERHR
ncbi:MAG: cytidylate kinase-like family protein [Gemmatirosa sp.]